MTTYQFDAQFQKGQAAETFLDNFFAERFTIQSATREEQRQGIDRHYTNKTTGAAFSVEYKTDWLASQTHNVFIETVSVDTANKPGWIYTSQAYRLFYYIPGDDLIYILRMMALRKLFEKWVTQYPARKVRNKGYFTHGVCVPQVHFERHSEHVINIAG